MRFMSAIACVALTSCATPEPTSETFAAADMFMGRLSNYCGQAFAGRMVSNDAADDNMATAPMIMHVRSCDQTETRIPFHVGKPDGSWDRSRTWVVSRTAAGLRLKHDHRHEDGSADKVTMYGGDTRSEGTAGKQEFLVDDESVALFRREGLDRSVTNVWAIEISAMPNPVFAYELRRTGDAARHFRVEFDLTKPVELPPAPWSAPE
jgi:hypothetical protein